MNGTATQFFQCFRVCSVPRPNMQVGLIHGYGGYTREQLEQADAGSIGFYLDDMLQQMRGSELDTEEFTLQGGISADGPWEDIKPIAPVLEINSDDENDGRWGQCKVCGDNLTEGEYSTGDVCDGCMPGFMEAHNLETERLNEEADERRRYPEESDDEDDEYDRYDG